MTLGAYDVTLIESEHCPPDRFPGVITEPVVPPVKASAYKCGEAWSTLVHHRPSDRRLLIVGSAGFVPAPWPGTAPTWSTSASGSSVCSPSTTSSTTGPRRCGPSARAASCSIHWDDFFRPLHEAAARAAVRR